MEYLLLVISFLLRTYGAVQEKRDLIDLPMFWHSDAARNTLALFWIAMLGGGIYFVWLRHGLLVVVIAIILYFLVLPMIFGKLIKEFMEKLGF